MGVGDWVRGLAPRALASRASGALFDRVAVDPSWERTVREAALRGRLVHVLRRPSLVDLLALVRLSKRLGLPPVGFSNEFSSYVAGRRAGEREEEALARALERGESAVLFLKRPASAGEALGAGRREGPESDALFRRLFAMQREGPAEILVVPHAFVWTYRPERAEPGALDVLFGSTGVPDGVRSGLGLVFDREHAVLRAGEPSSLREFLAQEEEAAGGDDFLLARRLAYALVRKVERERRAMLGPARRGADRVREEVLRSPKLQRAIRELAGPSEAERERVTERARRMLRGLQADPDPATVRALETLAGELARVVYAGIDVDEAGIERVREASRRGSVVYLPSHKSHVDYLLLSYVLRKHALQVPVIAAGDNLNFFPVGPIFRRAGAFFIRRSFKGDRLYVAVVDAYVRRLLREGHAIEFFLEGGRSRTGKLLSPKLGLLTMLVEAAAALERRPVSFVPVAIGYERMMEEGAYARELSGGQKRKEDAAALLKVGAVLREKYGRVNLQFGRIIDLDEVLSASGAARGEPLEPAKKREIVSRLGHRAMHEIGLAMAATAGSLVATVLLTHGRRGMGHAELVQHAARLLSVLRRAGARLSPSLVLPSGELREASIREAALLYARGGLLRQHVPGDTLTAEAKRRAKLYRGDDVIYTVPDEKRLLLDLSKNILVHFLLDRALVSLALLADPGPPAKVELLRERVQSLSRLFKFEFSFRADAPFDRIFDETIADMVEVGELSLSGSDSAAEASFGPGHDGQDGRAWVAFYAAVLRNFVEGYRVAARAVRGLAQKPLPQKELVQRALRLGERMFLSGEIERSEAVSRPIFESALAAFVEQGYLTRASGALALTPSFASEEAASVVEAKVAAYLQRRAEARA